MNILQRVILTSFFFLLPGLVFAVDVTIDNAWIREAPPISRVQAGYLSLHNTSNNQLNIVGATSPAFSSIGFHETVVENGLSKMFHLESITLPAKSNVDLKPEGMHLMLFNPVKPLRNGDTVDITFHLDNDMTIKSSFKVKKSNVVTTH